MIKNHKFGKIIGKFPNADGECLPGSTVVAARLDAFQGLYRGVESRVMILDSTAIILSKLPHRQGTDDAKLHRKVLMYLSTQLAAIKQCLAEVSDA